MHKSVAVLAVFAAILFSGCSALRQAGITSEYDQAVKLVVLHQVQTSLAKEGITSEQVSQNELAAWYDTFVAISAVSNLAEEILLNAAVSNRAAELIERYRAEVIPAPVDTNTAAAPVETTDAWPAAGVIWSAGGVDGSAVVHDPAVEIADLKLFSDKLTFRWVANMSAWGIPHTEAKALACLFVQMPDGTWEGGKFDWISSSRTERDFLNLDDYRGWGDLQIPNPAEVLFVVIYNGKRSNALAGTWSR